VLLQTADVHEIDQCERDARQRARPACPARILENRFSDQKVQPPERADGRIKLAPERVEGLGEEAFWTGGPAGGLYVLKGETVLFIGIGAPATRQPGASMFAALPRSS
jgi:hypothetical protein